MLIKMLFWATCVAATWGHKTEIRPIEHRGDILSGLVESHPLLHHARRRHGPKRDNRVDSGGTEHRKDILSGIVKSRLQFQIEPHRRSLKGDMFSSGTPVGHGCKTSRFVLRVAYPGCKPKQVMTTGCRGACRSYSFPEWHREKESTNMVRNCSCCKPLRRRAITTSLECPFRARGRKKLVIWGAINCRCRPCSS